MNQHTHISLYVDGVETDINTLGDFQDMLVFIISEYTSYTVVKTYIMDKLYYYGICAATYVDKSSTIAITIDTESDRGYKSPLPELDILAKHPTGILEDWANQLSRTHKSGTIYVDGIKVDIDNLGITISSMELIYIVDDIFSYTVVRSDTDEVDYYTIKCIFDSEK